MKACLLNRTGSISELRAAEVQNQEPGKDEVLVKVDYTGVNHLDLLIIHGKRKTSGRFPLIIGSEITGTEVESGEKVVVYPWTFCGKCEECKMGNENICNDSGTYGRTRDGGYAEYVAVEKKNLVKLSEQNNLKLIAASALSAITALHMIKRANIPEGAAVLVNGASGGVGTAAIQILKARKCRVIASTSHPLKSQKLINTGADEVISSQTLTDSLEKIQPRGVPFIIDAIGGNIWSLSVKNLAKNGTIVFCATTLEETGSVNIGNAFAKQLNILGSYGGTIEDLKEVINLIRKEIIKPVIDSIYNLDQVPQALRKLEDQKAFGKILVSPLG